MNEIVLLTSSDCALCEQAKQLLTRVGEERDLQVREISLQSDEGRRLGIEAGAPFPPVLFLNGRPFSYGRLSERRLRKALR